VKWRLRKLRATIMTTSEKSGGGGGGGGGKYVHEQKVHKTAFTLTPTEGKCFCFVFLSLCMHFKVIFCVFVRVYVQEQNAQNCVYNDVK
jgi:hypothetical protein